MQNMALAEQGRQFLSDEIYKETGVNSVIEKDHWTMSLLIPEKFLKEVCDYLPDGSGKEIYCNFINFRDPAVEHYISFSPIDSEKPNFHLPVFFAKSGSGINLKSERKRDMVLYQAKDYKDMSRKAANIISAQVIMKPNAVLGLATGSTPVGAYEQLVEWYNKGDIDFSQVTSVNLDEYKGLSGDNDQSYRYFMNKNLFDHVNIDKARTFVPDGTEPDSKVACAKYNAIIDSVGGIDLQLLGIGGNGHIGFNEPGSAFESLTHCVALKEDTIKANARFFETMDDVPKYAYTMGIKNIMSAKKVLLLASGKNKAKAVYESFFGPIVPGVPASVLQLHNDVIVIADEEALSLCREKGVI